jgi:ELWxxDGT repeat protein
MRNLKTRLASLIFLACFSIHAQSVKLIDSGDLPVVYKINGRIVYFNQGRIYFSNGNLAQTASMTIDQYDAWFFKRGVKINNGQKDQYIWHGSQGRLIKTDGTLKGSGIFLDTGGHHFSTSKTKLYYSIYEKVFETDGTKEGTRLIINDLHWDSQIFEVVFYNKDSFIIYLAKHDSTLCLKSTNIHNLKSEILIDSLSPYSLHYTTIYPFADKNLSPVIVLKKNEEKQLYLTDGRRNNTRFIKRVSEYEYNYPLNKIARLNDTFYYVSGYPISYLWKFHNQTNSLINLFQLSGGGAIETRMGDYIQIGVLSNQSIVVPGYSKANSFELWHSDGTAQNTRMLKDINPGKDSSIPRILLTANKKAYFRATTPGAGRELWVTNGTAIGTRMIKDCIPGPATSFPDQFLGSGSFKSFTIYGPDSFMSDYRIVLGLDTRNDSVYSYSDLARNPQGLLHYIYRNDSQIAIYYLNNNGPEIVVTSLDKTKVQYLTFPCQLKLSNPPGKTIKISSTDWVFLKFGDNNNGTPNKLWWYFVGQPCIEDQKLLINPNPASNELRVLFEFPLPKDAVLRIYNILGQLIREEKLPENMPMGWRIFDISNIKTGSYIIQVKSGSVNKTAKWIKI